MVNYENYYNKLFLLNKFYKKKSSLKNKKINFFIFFKFYKKPIRALLFLFICCLNTNSLKKNIKKLQFFKNQNNFIFLIYFFNLFF